MESYQKIILLCKEVVSEMKSKEKKSKSIDHARSNIQIERMKHDIHCLCVELGIAEYEEHRYGEKRRRVDGFHEVLVNFRKPNIT